MGFVDRIQENAARSAAARKAGRADGRQGAGQVERRPERKPRRLPAPPMTHQERSVAFGLAVAAAVAFAAIWAPHLGHTMLSTVAKGSKAKPTRISPTAELVWGLVLAALVGWSAVLRKRWLVAGVAFYVGLLGPWSSYRYLGYVLMAGGAWLLFRNAKLQAEAQRGADAAAAKTAKGKSSRGSPATGSAKAVPPRRGPSTHATGRDSTRTTGSARKRKEAPSDPTGRAVPAPSKRYTPPHGDRKERRERREGIRAGARASAAPGAGASSGARASAAPGASAANGASTAPGANRSASPKV